MKILLTGASGFLGSIIRLVLAEHDIMTVGRAAQSDIKIDISASAVALPKADLVVHAAGKAHIVPNTPEERKAFFDVNVNGTANLLKSLESNPPAAFIFISSVSVYGKNSGELITEDAELAATDPYGVSKIEAEKLVVQWCTQYKVTYSILRLPLIAGPNPPGNLKAMIKGIRGGYYFNVAGGQARKSIVLANDVAKIIPMAASVGGIYNLTDGKHPSFAELSTLIAGQLQTSKPKNLPFLVARIMALGGDLLGTRAPINTNKLSKLVSTLTFSDSKARAALQWAPHPVVEQFRI